MIIENKKIVKCTDLELFEYWLKNWSDLIDYNVYKKRCIELGTEVEGEEE